MLRSSEAESSEPFPGVVLKPLAIGALTNLVEVSIRKGAVVPNHSHANEQVGYVVKGRMRMEIGKDGMILSEGDSYVIPSNVAHNVTALEDIIAIDIFSPPREEDRYCPKASSQDSSSKETLDSRCKQ